jgi:hypothetical protein
MDCPKCGEKMAALREHYVCVNEDGTESERSEYTCKPCQVGAHPLLGSHDCDSRDDRGLCTHRADYEAALDVAKLED